MKNEKFEILYADNSRKILEIYRKKRKSELDVLTKNDKIGEHEKDVTSNISEK